MQYHCETDRIGIIAGTIDESVGSLKLVKHIFLKEKASWFDVPDDGTEKYDGFDPTSEEMLRKWREEQA